MVKRVEKSAVAPEFKALRSRLTKEKQRLLDELAQFKAAGEGVVGFPEIRHEGSPFGKREEEATEVLELDKRLALEKRIREQLTEVEHALDKFDHGTYGRCDNCGNPIGLDRLEAMPQARLCMTCKAKQVSGKIR